MTKSSSEKAIWRLILLILAIEAFFVVLNCVNLPTYILTRSFDLDGEANITTWFSSIQLFALGLVSLMCLHAELDRSRNIISLCGWVILVAIFWALSMDEVATLHELVAKSLATHYDIRAFRIRGFVWVYFLAPPAFVAAIFMGYFFTTRFRRVKKSFALAISGLALWAMVLPLEFLGGRYANANVEFWKTIHYKVLTNLEETCEMVGASLILGSLLFFLNYLHSLKFKEM